MHKKKILSLLMAGAMLMVSPVAAFANEADLGDPESVDTSLRYVSVSGYEGDIDGSDITVEYKLTDYPSESDIKIGVTDYNKSHYDPTYPG